jgi:hypothetical protein
LRTSIARTAILVLLPISALAGSVSAGPYTKPGHAIGDASAWATSVKELVRGPKDIADPGGGDVTFGSGPDALGPATGVSTDTVSLGDGGSITLGFPVAIADRAGDDFAVFENAFFAPGGLFAELAFVSVSTNGLHFAVFDPISLQASPVPAFGEIDPSDYYNLAGDQPAGTGTGFDLSELAGHPLVGQGLLDLSRVHYVKLTDVIGDGSTFDSFASPVYDPYATPFEVGGFDVDAVAVLNGVALPMLPIGSLSVWLVFALLGATGLRALRSAPAGVLAVGLLAAATLGGSTASATPVGFEDLGLGSEDFYNGSDGAGGFTSNGVFFENDYSPDFGGFWSGFSASTTTDTTTPGFGNQYSAITAGGAGGSDAFGVSFFDSRLEFASEVDLVGGWFTNTTFAFLSMRDGDGFAKRFGGGDPEEPPGDDPDFFLLTITAFDALAVELGSAELYLADFRFGDNSEDYILDEWTFLDLSSLTGVKELEFGLSSSDNDPMFGMNTPAYFALDDLAAVSIPEPGTVLLLGLSLVLLVARRPRLGI